MRAGIRSSTLHQQSKMSDQVSRARDAVLATGRPPTRWSGFFTKFFKDYQCWNFGQQNEIRHQYLTEVNKLRAKIADGTAPNNAGNCPQGKNIYRLDWDCILENLAQDAVDACPTTAPQDTDQYSVVFNETTLTTCNPNPLLKKQMSYWWSEVETVGLDTNVASKDGLKNFAAPFFSRAPATGQPIYELGTGCTDASQCTTYKESKCQQTTKLCRAGYPTNETVAPPPSGDDTSSTATTTTTTPTTTAATTTKPGAVESQHCKGQETMNTDEARDEFLKVHNECRAKVAKGGIRMGNGISSRACPRMKKIPKYDCELEKKAYATASACKSADPETENENWFTTTAATEKDAATKAMESWSSEIATGHMLQATGSQNLLQPSLNIRHFARMVWDLNTQMGCAVKKCSNDWHVVCHYGPGVGRLGSPIYFMGPKACNQCLDKCENDALCLP
ncbi:hypothetical protein Y032_0009g461 [Ancylostoma ceylanicum]|uniref:SCP domain-containing protein n=1 Tax=Ancylostoma ceylanicum TaxID=53326 RepID=A0A016VHU4_9BILA|nr:hypothetical protein Y032_0009g461 [Ancylostoma ceylanicum]